MFVYQQLRLSAPPNPSSNTYQHTFITTITIITISDQHSQALWHCETFYVPCSSRRTRIVWLHISVSLIRPETGQSLQPDALLLRLVWRFVESAAFLFQKKADGPVLMEQHAENNSHCLSAEPLTRTCQKNLMRT